MAEERGMGEQREFWSRVARAYDRVVDLQIGGATRSLVRERAASEGRLGRLVELGCGTGFFTQALAAKADRVAATDLSDAMLALATARVQAPNVTFQVEDAQRTSFPEAVFDTAFMSLVLHFTEPDVTLAEMQRIVRPGGTLVVANLDPGALAGFARARAMIRVLYRGITGYRVKPPRAFGRNVLTGAQLRERLATASFEVVGSETITDPARSSSIPIGYVRATRR